MDTSLTYKDLLEFPINFIKESEKYQDFAELISKAECDSYNTRELKAKVEKRIQRFKDAKYIYKFPNEKYYCSITPNYQLREVMTPRNLESPQSRMVSKDVDKTIWVTKMYYVLMDIVSTKLTHQETIYFIDCLFKNVTEEITMEKLSICKDTLTRLKKSCLIKVWTEMEALIEYEDFK